MRNQCNLMLFPVTSVTSVVKCCFYERRDTTRVALMHTHYGCLYTTPPFITNTTRPSAVMSFVGSPSTAMMSAW